MGPERHSSQIRVCANTVDSASFFIYSDKHGDFCCTLVTLNILDNFISCFSRKVSAKKNITSKIILLYLLYAIISGQRAINICPTFSSSVIAFRISCAFCVTEAEGGLGSVSPVVGSGFSVFKLESVTVMESNSTSCTDAFKSNLPWYETVTGFPITIPCLTSWNIYTFCSKIIFTIILTLNS